MIKALVSVLCLSIGLSACVPETPSTSPKPTQQQTATAKINGSWIDEALGDDLNLTNHHGQNVSLKDFQGKVVAVSFGYSHCPDVCPTNLLDLAKTLKLLGEQAKDVQVLFVSVDPTRDTPAVLSEYVTLFDERFVGLSAKDDDSMQATLKAWKIAATKVPISDGNYSVDHSAGLYLVNQQGQAAVYLPYGSSAEKIAQDMQTLLNTPL